MTDSMIEDGPLEHQQYLQDWIQTLYSGTV